jgi:S-adenosylmethionine decarboxylase proenzyme
MNSPIGKHIILDLYNVNVENLHLINQSDDTKDIWDKFMETWFEQANITCVQRQWHDFEGSPGAFTALYLLSESHLSIHTWPEKRYVAIDIFTCGKCDVELLSDKLTEYFEPEYKNVHRFERGENL